MGCHCVGAGWAVKDDRTVDSTVRRTPQGSTPVGDRAIFTAFAFVLTSEYEWRHLPPWFGVTVPTAHGRVTTLPQYSLHRAGLARVCMRCP